MALVADDQAAALRQMAQRRSGAEPPARRAPVIAIASGKGGVGKTTIAVSMGITLARRGLKVALVDADLGLANADLMCGLRPTARLSEAIARVAQGDRVSVDLVRRMSMRGPAGMVVVPGMVGPLRHASSMDARTAVSQTVDLLARAMDVVVVDHGAGLGASVRDGLSRAALPLVVATPDPASLADAYALVKSVRSCASERIPYLLLNRAKDADDARSAHARVAEVAAKFLGCGLPLVGFIPEDPMVQRCSRARRPLAIAAPKSSATRHLNKVVDRLAEEVGPDRSDSDRPVRPRRGLLARLVRDR